MRGRNNDAEEAIVRRLATASREVSAVEEYDYVVVNDDLMKAAEELAAIVRTHMT